METYSLESALDAILNMDFSPEHMCMHGFPLDDALTDGGNRLADLECGSTVRFGDDEFIVLEHFSNGTTAVITKGLVRNMEFGRTGTWEESDVRRYCNGEFYSRLASCVGNENIVPHRVSLAAEDGMNPDATSMDSVSLLSTHLYRRYRRFLPAIGRSAIGRWWWLANQPTAIEDYARSVCGVDSNGVLDWGGCGYGFGVRPFCILNSSILINEV